LPVTLSTKNLVKYYFNICNTALVEHRDNPLFKAAVSLADKFAGGDNISLQVVNDAGESLGHFTTYFKDGQFGPTTEGVHEPDKAFIVKQAFLQEVVDNGDEYIKRPSKLDWSWLTNP
jgi:hypothetical protein